MNGPQIIAFAPLHDSGTPKHPHDATGAFQPEARSFLGVWRDRFPRQAYVTIDQHASQTAIRGAVCAPIVRGVRELAAVAILCHGWKTGIQLGFANANAVTLAEVLAAGLRPDGVVALYACDAARDYDQDRDDDLRDGPGGDGGFADTLRDALVPLRPDWTGWIDAHESTAHTTKNPDVRRFGADGSSLPLVARGSPAWPAWRRALQGDLRWRFPLMLRAAVEAEIAPRV